jgi:ComF family protein
LRNGAAVLLDLLAPPLCWSCAAPAVRGAGLCTACRRSLRFLGGGPALLCGLAVWAPVAYDGPARELVKALKFHAAAGIADEMAALVAANAPASLLTATLVPVPLHQARRRIRPFNQAELLARAISARAARAGRALPIHDCLARSGAHRPQVGRGRAARLQGPAGAIRASGPAPPNVLLVDDVVTTGATLAACAAALRGAGAEHVAAVAFARTAGR